MQKILTIVPASLLFLSGCSSKTNNAKPDYNLGYKSIDSDSIVAFGKITQSDELVMIGKKYAYKLTKQSSYKINTLINANFKAKFITNEAVKLVLAKDRSWQAQTKLAYTPQNNDEQIQLKKLGFNCPNGSCWHTFYLKGEMFNGANLAKNNLSNATHIDIATKNDTNFDDIKGVLKSIYLTPFALSFFIFMIPFIVVDEMFK